MDCSTIIVKNFNSPLKSVDISSNQNISKEMMVLNETDQMDLIILYRTFHLNEEEYTFFSNAHRTVSRMEHRFGHSLNNFKKIAIILNIFSGQNGMKLEVNYKNKIEKNHKYVEIEQYSAEQLQSH